MVSFWSPSQALPKTIPSVILCNQLKCLQVDSSFFLLAGGGEKSRNLHTSRGKLLPRERIDGLLDPGWFYFYLQFPLVHVKMLKAESDQQLVWYFESLICIAFLLLLQIPILGILPVCWVPVVWEGRGASWRNNHRNWPCFWVILNVQE